MFEDLIPKKETDKYKQCPYCKSFQITKAERGMLIDDRWRQLAKCKICNGNWMIVYSEDFSKVWIRLLDKGA